MSYKLDESIEDEVSVDLEKREFMSKFGKYAVVSVGMAALMTPNASASFNSGCKPRTRKCGGGSRPKKVKVTRVKGNNGWGNGDQRSPGNSLLRTRAENNHGGNPHQKGWLSRPN